MLGALLFMGNSRSRWSHTQKPVCTCHGTQSSAPSSCHRKALCLRDLSALDGKKADGEAYFPESLMGVSKETLWQDT